MPGLGDILMAITGGAAQGYANQISKQRDQKTQLVMQTLMKYPEAAGDPDMQKLAASAGIDKSIMPLIGALSTAHNRIAATQQQNQMQSTLAAVQRFQAGQAGTPGSPSDAVPAGALAAVSAGQPNTAAGAPGASALSPAPAPAPASATPSALSSGGDFTLPPPGRSAPKVSIDVGPKGTTAHVNLSDTPNLDEEDQKSLMYLSKLQKRFPNEYAGTLMDKMTEAGYTLKPATRNFVLEQAGDASVAALVQGQPLSADTFRRAAGIALSRGEHVSQGVLQMAGMQSPVEKYNEAVNKANADIPAAKAKAQNEADIQQAAHSVPFVDDTGKVRQVTQDEDKKAAPIITDFNLKMSKGPDLVKQGYNQIVGLLQHPEGLSQMDLVTAFARMGSASGRVSQTQIDNDIKAGVPAGEILKKFFQVSIQGNVITDRQVKQIRTAAFDLYQQSLKQEGQLRSAAEKQLTQRGLPKQLLPPQTFVENPQTGQPIKPAAAPATPTTSAAPMPKGFKVLDGPHAGETVSTPAAAKALGATRVETVQ